MLFLLFPPVQSVTFCQTKGVCFFCQTGISIILSEKDAILSARGKHTIGFVHTLCYQVVNQNANIRFVAMEDEGREQALTLSACFQGSVDTCHRSLPACFFISSSTIHLSCHEQILDNFRFQRVEELGWIEEIVFDSIARTIHLYIFESGHFLQSLTLYIHRE